MTPPVQVTKQGVLVWENETTEGMRKDEDLCLHCGNKQVCAIHRNLLSISNEKVVGIMVTYCPVWKPVA